jgi:deoxyribonuclease-4
VSISGGISNSVDNALKDNCTAFQIFTRNPRGWAAKPLDSRDVQLFKNKLSGYLDCNESPKRRRAAAVKEEKGEGNKRKAPGIDRNAVFAHMPYLPNLSSPNETVYDQSVKVLIDELNRCNILDIQYLVLHLGSHQGEGIKKGVDQLVNACTHALQELPSENIVAILLENSAGQKNTVASDFGELRLILDKLYANNPSNKKNKFTVCLDTCHAFAAGYDLASEEAVNETMDNFDSELGLRYLSLIHLNDSRDKLLSHRDRHDHIGLGEIGENGFRAFLNHKSCRGTPLIMETPIDSRRNNIDNLMFVQDIVSRI